jgi:hypothetical protein
MNHMNAPEGSSWIQQCKEDAARFDCRCSWRAARRVPLLSEDERPPYMLTVVGAMGAQILKSIQDDIYRNWPLPTPPPPPAPVEGMTWEVDDNVGQQSVYTFDVPGRTPVDVRMFTFNTLAAARRAKPGGIKAPRVKSRRRQTTSDNDKDH